MSIEIPDWVVQLAVDAYAKVNEECGEAVEYFPDAMTEALRAALEGWLVPRGYLVTWHSSGEERVSEIPAHRDDGTTEILYRLRKDKTP